MISAAESNPLEEDLNHILAHTSGLWDELRGKRLFISGGTGFFGCWLLESLLWANRKLDLNVAVTVLTRNPAAFKSAVPHLARDSAVSLLRGDVRSFEFPKSRFQFVIHAAGSASLNSESGEELRDTIVEGTRNMLELARQQNLSAFLFTSSGAVYGKQPSDLSHIPEEFAGLTAENDDRSVYAEGKRSAELLCESYSQMYGIKCKIARCFAFAGPYLPLDGGFAFGNFIRDALNGSPVEVTSDGTAVRSYLYGADLAIWLWTILIRGEKCRPYNVGSEAGLPLAVIARKVTALLGSRHPVNFRREPTPGVPGHRYVPSTARATVELGLSESICLDDAICSTGSWNSLRFGLGSQNAV